jgi:hypothetical protein
MTKSTYSFNPHTEPERDYPHTNLITFVVVTRHAPKSTYSPHLTESLVTWSDTNLRNMIDKMMGVDGMEYEMFDPSFFDGVEF